MQRLLILNAMRPERITQCITSFISTVLGQKKINLPADLVKVARTLKADHVPIILYRDDPQLAISKLQQYTSKVEVILTWIDVVRASCNTTVSGTSLF